MIKLFFDRDGLNYYPWYFADECLTKDIFDIFGKKMDKIILEFKGNNMRYYGDAEKLNEIGEFLFQKVKDDKKFYSLVEKNILETGDDLISFCDNLKDIDLKKVGNQDLLNFYNDYAQKLKAVRAWGWVPPLIDGGAIYFMSDYIQETFTNFLKGSIYEPKKAEFYSILSSSEKMSEVQTEEIERLKLLIEVKNTNNELISLLKESADSFVNKIESNYPDILKKIDHHTREFEWLPYAYIGPKMNRADTINLMRDSVNQKESVKEQIDKIRNRYKELPKIKNEIIEKVKLSEELKYLFDVSAFFMHLKDLRKGIYQKSYVAMDLVISEIADRIGLTLEQAKYLIAPEIEKALIDGQDYSKDVVERKNHSVVVVENGVSEVFIGEEANKIISEEVIEEQVETNISQIKGMVAFSGRVTGIVKIVAAVADISKIKEGEILVSPATNPDLVVAMKKAAAFVTDMGGITSHAAIVSREMEKPCIVGTRIATKVLHDGDLVEVNAIDGIVNIIERKK